MLVLGYVSQTTSDYRYDDPARLPVERIAIVFGAGVRRDGRPSRILADRVQAADDLYQAGRVRTLLMTGDNSSVDYDEVSAMRDYAVERGVASTDIALDYAGAGNVPGTARRDRAA